MKKIGVYSILGLVVAFSILSFSKLSQEYLLLQKVKAILVDYSRNLAPEKTYLHTDKDFYTNGETIWFKTYLVDGILHDRSDNSKVVYVELVNAQDSVIVQRKLFVDDIGASGDIQIDDNIAQGEYTLRSYTKYMLNDADPVVFEKSIPIFVQEIRTGLSAEQVPLAKALRGFERNTDKAIFGKPDIKFFPEGGHLVKGLPGTMGLEVLDAKGNGVALKGHIKNSKDEIVAPFESFEFGLGSVGFVPLQGEQYYASVIFKGTEQKFPLPEALASGCILSLKNREDHVLVQVASTTENGLEGTLLVGHLRGDLIFKRIGSSQDNASYATKIYTEELQDGVAQFTLFSGDGEPISERLVFIDNPENDARLTISAPTKTFGLRDKVNLSMALTDEEGEPLKGDFSMGVVSKNSSKGASNNIRSWLLLDSDLGGSVENPDFFFAEDSKQRKFLLDALMLTHGWRRFIWKDMLSKNVSKIPEYAPEKGIMVSGRTTKFKSPFQTKQTVTTLNLFGPELINSKKETNTQGEFVFGPFYFNGSLDATVEAYDSVPKFEYKRKNFSVFLNEQNEKLASKLKKTERTDRSTVELSQEYLKEEYRKKVNDFKYDPTKVTQLDEVIITEKKKTRTQISLESNPTSALTRSLFSRRVYTEDISGSKALSALDLIQRMPGIIVSGSYPRQEIRIIGMGQSSVMAGSDPLVLIDGVQSDFEFLRILRAMDVTFIDVVYGSDTAFWGSRGANGVIGVYTNPYIGIDRLVVEEYPGIARFKIPGFYKTREFYIPDYSKEDPEKPDYRTTLYWKPELTFNNQGKSTVDFFTGDTTGAYLVKVEGITNDGRPVNGLYDIEVVE
ncbi:TonB-dependent receptor plug domain-containing protein [Maribacter antarcticus]|uniref:TonB-dependent receptor plug domain-containing protein n=1 Tax=Maribacter antarcticus TaxID=505250 RepID=UPI00047D9B05|nr:TonB-dependent receptor plug domain-containing protein [Maribacter antarcticus]